MTVVKTSTMPREKRNDVTVKIDAKVYRRAKMVASHRNIPLSEFLTELLDKPVAREYGKMKQELGEETEGE